MTNRSDNFNRADTASGIGTPSDGGSAWSQLFGTWGIAGNKAYESAGSDQGTCALDAASSVVTVQVTLSGTLSEAGLIARAADANNYILFTFGGGIVRLFKRVAGSFTSIGPVADAPYTYTAGDIAKLDIDASNNISGIINGVTLLTANDAAGSTNTKHGLRAYFDTAIRFDDFSITDNAVGGAASIPVFMHHFRQQGIS